MIRTGISLLAATALGCAAGIALWALSVFALFAFGLSFYAVNTALPVALAAAALMAVLIYRRNRLRSPQTLRLILAFFIGATAILLYGSIAVVLTAPHTIAFFT
jgi:hypothetical protein